MLKFQDFEDLTKHIKIKLLPSFYSRCELLVGTDDRIFFLCATRIRKHFDNFFFEIDSILYHAVFEYCSSDRMTEDLCIFLDPV